MYTVLSCECERSNRLPLVIPVQVMIKNRLNGVGNGYSFPKIELFHRVNFETLGAITELEQKSRQKAKQREWMT